jgi:hypothetical protein
MTKLGNGMAFLVNQFRDRLANYRRGARTTLRVNSAEGGIAAPLVVAARGWTRSKRSKCACTISMVIGSTHGLRQWRFVN